MDIQNIVCFFKIIQKIMEVTNVTNEEIKLKHYFVKIWKRYDFAFHINVHEEYEEILDIIICLSNEVIDLDFLKD